MEVNCKNLNKCEMEKNGCFNEYEYKHAVAKEIIRVLSICGSSYEDAQNIFEIATWHMNNQSVQTPGD